MYVNYLRDTLSLQEIITWPLKYRVQRNSLAYFLLLTVYYNDIEYTWKFLHVSIPFLVISGDSLFVC